jgi:PKD repeat protein
VTVTVSLTVTSDCIPVSGAQLSLTPEKPTIGDVVTFSGRVEAGTKPVTFQWDLGEGGAPQTGNPVQHAYTSFGVFSTTLTATNVCGSSEATKPVTVNAGPLGGFEPNDTCDQASPIPTDGTVQVQTFYQEEDVDWVAFDAVAGTTYLIEAQIPVDSAADVALELFDQCGAGSIGSQDYTFSPDVRLEFQAAADGQLVLKLSNDHDSGYGSQTAYHLSVRALGDIATPGALIVVAGRIKADDPVQSNIHHVTDAVYQLFFNHDYNHDRIHYLATDMNLTGYDVPATAANLEAAITTWALDKVGSSRPLTLYLIDHGAYDKLYLDKTAGEWVTPAQVDGWLDQLESSVPGLKVNVIIEACHSGSFIDADESLSEPGRVVIASTGALNRAWASASGAVFSDHFIGALDQGDSLYNSFQKATWATQAAHPNQTPWLDDDGDEVANGALDGVESARRGFAFAGTLPAEQWPPYVVQVKGPIKPERTQGVIEAEVRDDEGVDDVWAVIYPPSYQAPEPGEEMVDEVLPTIVLQPQQGRDDWYAALYTGFLEQGVYTVVVYAEDFDDLAARPVAIEIGRAVYLPLVMRW